AKRGANFDRFEADVKRYNEIALKVMKELEVPVDDLHAVVDKGGPEKLLLKDGTHYTPEGYKLLAESVTESVKKFLSPQRKQGDDPTLAGASGSGAVLLKPARVF